MQQDRPEVLVADAASESADPGFAAAAHRILDSLVRDGAALGWIDPPSPAEVAALLQSVGSASAAGEAALRAVYSPAAGAPPGSFAAGPAPGNGGGLGRQLPPPAQLIGLGYWTRYERPTHRHHADLRRIAVAARAQGRGAGRALTSALIDSARTAGIEVLTLDARGDNAGALRLYRSLGFREYGRLRDFVAVGDRRYDTVFCALDLRDEASGPAPADAPA